MAAEAGVAKATLYDYFPTLDDVVRALLAAELDRLRTLASSAPAVLADELATHPVLRRLADAEPEQLAVLLGADGEHWAQLTAWLGGMLHVDADAAELAGRWLVGVVVQPGRTTGRRRQAAVLAAVAPAGA
ncbi:TetR family transcriptional regulator [Blastococcus saxobsidens]|uniref:TetR family transcriptional regulator n=1 Tax=Blastococcus saxobsidens TaxID=138336 RepID=UPI001F5F0338|nr:TetR family transcriptional regulator [Blastococcus saxobsidens]